MEDGFIQRIQQLTDYLGINYITLADRMGVQRSTFSHLLSGRNKPGFDFLVRLQQAYPQVNLHWLITGMGSIMLSSATDFSSAQHLHSSSFTHQPPDPIYSPLQEVNDEDVPPYHTPPVSAQPVGISRVLIFYTDGRIEEHIHSPA